MRFFGPDEGLPVPRRRLEKQSGKHVRVKQQETRGKPHANVPVIWHTGLRPTWSNTYLCGMGDVSSLATREDISCSVGPWLCDRHADDSRWRSELGCRDSGEMAGDKSDASLSLDHRRAEGSATGERAGECVSMAGSAPASTASAASAASAAAAATPPWI